jgi:hypothetical protein
VSVRARVSDAATERGRAAVSSRPSVRLRHLTWNHVMNSGAGMIAPLLDSSTLLLNTSAIDTEKYARTTSAIFTFAPRGDGAATTIGVFSERPPGFTGEPPESMLRRSEEERGLQR